MQLVILAALARSIRPVIGVPIASSAGYLPPTLNAVAEILDTGVEIHGARLIDSLRDSLAAQLLAVDTKLTGSSPSVWCNW
jgi:hypothetical protein